MVSPGFGFEKCLSRQSCGSCLIWLTVLRKTHDKTDLKILKITKSASRTLDFTSHSPQSPCVGSSTLSLSNFVLLCSFEGWKFMFSRLFNSTRQSSLSRFPSFLRRRRCLSFFYSCNIIFQCYDSQITFDVPSPWNRHLFAFFLSFLLCFSFHMTVSKFSLRKEVPETLFT